MQIWLDLYTRPSDRLKSTPSLLLNGTVPPLPMRVPALSLPIHSNYMSLRKRDWPREWYHT
jgi:hypothetical protein